MADTQHGMQQRKDDPNGRRARGLDDASITEAAIRLLATDGVDALSLPRLAATGHFTSAPLYRRFDTGTDVAVDVWRSDLRPLLRRACRAAANWQRPELEADGAWLDDLIRTPSPETRALVSVLGASRRLGPAGEIVRLDVEADLESLTAEHAGLPPVMVTGLVTPVLGAWLLAPVAPFTLDAVARSRRDFADAYADQRFWKATSDDAVYVPPAEPTPASEDPTLDDLRAATVRVVSRYGCAGATSNRISREAGRSITAAYRRLGNKDELINDAIRFALTTDFGFTGAEAASSMPFSRADRLQRSLRVTRHHIDSRNRQNRMFLLETLAAAHYDITIRRAMSEWFGAAHQRFLVGAAALGSADEATLVARWEYRVVTGIGALLLSAVSQRWIDQLDPMPVIQANDEVCLGDLADR